MARSVSSTWMTGRIDFDAGIAAPQFEFVGPFGAGTTLTRSVGQVAFQWLSGSGQGMGMPIRFVLQAGGSALGNLGGGALNAAGTQILWQYTVFPTKPDRHGVSNGDGGAWGVVELDVRGQRAIGGENIRLLAHDIGSPVTGRIAVTPAIRFFILDP